MATEPVFRVGNCFGDHGVFNTGKKKSAEKIEAKSIGFMYIICAKA